MRRHRPSRAPLHRLLALVAAILVAAGCTDGSPADDADESGRDATTAATSDAGASSGPDDDASSDQSTTPLAAFLGVGATELSEDELSAARREQDAYHQAVADCMAAQGFTYEPPSTDAGGSTGHIWDLPRDEFVASYGYGISTVSRSDTAQARRAESDRVAAMNAAERAAYHRALHGEAMALDDEGYPAHPAPAPGRALPGDADPGCSATAAQDVEGQSSDAPDSTDALAAFAPLMDDMQALWERVDDDPRVVAAASAWSDCMADAGFPGFTWPDDPEFEVGTRVRELLGGDDTSDIGAALEDADPAAVEEVRSFELDVAAADHACSGPFDEVRHEVQVEVEQAFLDANRDALEDYRDAMATVGGVG